MISTNTIKLQTSGFCDVHDLTERIAGLVRDSGIRNGTVTVFVPGSTAGITTIEYEPGLRKDLPELFEKLIPSDRTYHHDATWGDGNGFSHLRASLVGPSLTVPIVSSRMTLGTWQQVVLLCFDNRERRREIVVQIVGE